MTLVFVFSRAMVFSAWTSSLVQGRSLLAVGRFISEFLCWLWWLGVSAHAQALFGTKPRPQQGVCRGSDASRGRAHVPSSGLSPCLLRHDVVFSSAFICPQEIDPERPKVPSVASRDRSPELAAIEHGGHHAGEAGSVSVMEESHEESGLPIAHHDT